MKKTMKVLIAYDGSACAEAAIEDLKRAGLPDRLEALVVSVAEVFMPPAGDEKALYAVVSVVEKGWARAAEIVEESKALAKKGAKKVKANFPNWNVAAEGFADSPAWGIVKKAQEWQVDLIVVGAHGLSSSTGRLILGSIAQIVATQASCSVRVVRIKSQDAASPSRIVIGNDESPDSDRAILEVASRNWAKGTAVHLITAVEPRLTSLLAIELEMRRWIHDTDKTEFEAIKRLMESKAEKLRAKQLVVTCLIKEGDPKKIILEEAERWGADAIYVGARGLSGIKHALIGSVSASLAGRAHCTVEIVRDKTQTPIKVDKSKYVQAEEGIKDYYLETSTDDPELKK